MRFFFPHHELFPNIWDLRVGFVMKSTVASMYVCLCRWVHAVCESLYTEDEVEQASDEGFACTSCSAYVPKPVGESHNNAFYNRRNPIDYGLKNIPRIFSYLRDTIFFCFSSLLFAFAHSSRVSHYGFNKDQRARSVDLACSYFLSQGHDAWSSVTSHSHLPMLIYRTPVLPVGGCVADGVGYVPTPQHLHVSPAQEAAASLPSRHSVL